jgi:hypothetical protein
MNLLKNADSYVAACLRRVAGARTAFVALLVCLLASASSAAIDYTAMTGDVTTEISGAATVLMGIAGAIIGVCVIFIIYRFVRRLMG